MTDFAQSLLTWYDEVKRDLPWRRQKDPYAILVSELMLQQTQIDTVLRFYDPFLKRFPNLRSLAEATEDEVLTAWKGLGYYRRARNLHGAVKTIASQYGGEFPTTYDQWLELPGVGPYTAAAMSSIAFGKPHAVVDGNVLRVAARLFRIEEPIDRASVKRLVQNRMDELISHERPGDFNQAVMELGQSVCTLHAPACPQCPVSRWCGSKGREDVTKFPVSTRRVKQEVERRHIFVIVRKDFVQMRKRPDKGLLAGMWEFVNLQVNGDDEVVFDANIIEQSEIVVNRLGPLTHRFSHLIWDMELFKIELPAKTDVPAEFATVWNKRGLEYEWIHQSGVGSKALPTVMQKVWQRACD